MKAKLETKSFASELLEKYNDEKEPGERGEKVGREILEKYEGFEKVLMPSKKFRGQPFDRLGIKGGVWYIAEIKAAKRGFGGTPGYTQKYRMRLVLEKVKGLEPCLLQINLRNCKYHIRYGLEVRKLIEEHERKQQAINEITKWIEDTI